MRSIILVGGLCLSAVFARGAYQATATQGIPDLECADEFRLVTQFSNYDEHTADEATPEAVAESLIGEPVVSDELDSGHEVQVARDGESPVVTILSEDEAVLAIVTVESAPDGTFHPVVVEACA